MACSPAQLAYARAYYQRNREAIAEKARSPARRAQMRKYMAKRQAEQPERVRAICRKSDARRDHSARGRQWRANNPGKRLAYNATRSDRAAAIEGKRRAAKILATPSWANQEKVNEIYAQAGQIGWDVDHIVPLRSALVCGLHTEANLRPLHPVENRSKKNRWWPDMFEETSNL